MVNEPYRRRAEDSDISNGVIWNELCNLRTEVSSLKGKVYLMFGGYSVIGVALMLVDLLTKR